jgi:hypothetical protein
MGVRSWAGFLLIVIARIAALWQHDIVDRPQLPNWFLPFLGIGENETPANVDRVLGKPPKLVNLRSVIAELTHVIPA